MLLPHSTHLTLSLITGYADPYKGMYISKILEALQFVNLISLNFRQCLIETPNMRDTSIISG
jgi:hypothetical protein